MICAIFKCFIPFCNERRGFFYWAPVWGLSIFLLASRQFSSHACSENTGNEYCVWRMVGLVPTDHQLLRMRRAQVDALRPVSLSCLNPSVVSVTDTLNYKLERYFFWFADHSDSFFYQVAAEWSVPTSQNRSALSQRAAGIDFRDQY